MAWAYIAYAASWIACAAVACVGIYVTGGSWPMVIMLLPAMTSVTMSKKR